MENLRHIQVPNGLIETENIEPKDLVIYLALKSFDGHYWCQYEYCS